MLAHHATRSAENAAEWYIDATGQERKEAYQRIEAIRSAWRPVRADIRRAEVLQDYFDAVDEAARRHEELRKLREDLKGMDYAARKSMEHAVDLQKRAMPLMLQRATRVRDAVWTTNLVLHHMILAPMLNTPSAPPPAPQPDDTEGPRRRRATRRQQERSNGHEERRYQ